ncbi:hypothetical protein GCM10009785_25460 [Brooklawnia cerclae]|uniref:DUF4244 domain-containing protein n=1 Tax=Brooklawnia cerclae TaxID=349934 RepID=A0ABX0SAR4_9ACTN|nr:DUF4244 domain-containing protein [Brooklawnia cerclae]NIH55490.1 hypothetical protein [Brooklawnia cerclae]
MIVNRLHPTQVVVPVAGPKAPVRRVARSVTRAWQRGMATAEYAVGILAAVALALVLLKIFTNNDFFSTLLKFVVGLIGKASGMLP